MTGRLRVGKRHGRDALQRSPCLSFEPDVCTHGFAAGGHYSTFAFFRYVFENYTWDTTPGDFSSFNGKPIPARVPLTALLSGTSHSLRYSPYQCRSRSFGWRPVPTFRSRSIARGDSRILQSSLPESNNYRLRIIQCSSIWRIRGDDLPRVARLA